MTDERIELDEYLKDTLGKKLRVVADRIKEHPELEITYFRPDTKKEGGAYVTTIGTATKINEYERLVILMDGTEIPIDEIIGLDVRFRNDL